MIFSREAIIQAASKNPLIACPAILADVISDWEDMWKPRTARDWVIRGEVEGIGAEVEIIL